MLRRITINTLVAFLVCCTWRAEAQQFDPRSALSTLISAFQHCGPAGAYQLLSPYLFNLVSLQTANMGCYAAMAAAGPVTGMQVIDSAMFPAGPLYIVRVTHTTPGQVDWFIGFDKVTSQVIYLTFQSVITGPTPSVAAGADRSANLGLVKPPPKHTDDSDDKTDDKTDETADNKPNDKNAAACKKFPQMCP
jgi:hypothetical protein